MPVYTCERCLQKFKQKGHLANHMKRKNPCQEVKSELKSMVESAVESKMENIIIDKKLKSNDASFQNVMDNMETQNTTIKADNEHEKYTFQTMLTCIGNKRRLVKDIRIIVENVGKRLDKEKLNIVDGFSGSSVVSRELCNISDKLYINDMELYSYLMAVCFLKTPDFESQEKIRNHIDTMNEIGRNGPYIEGIISKNYAPKKTDDIQKGERCFYTRENALIIDTLRNYIEKHVEQELETYCLVPLLTRASIHSNTAGVFKGFYKNNDVGKFGGKGENALERITKPIVLDYPIWNNYDYKINCFNKNIGNLIVELPDDIDIIYLDPPYNQHPYGSNYFMMNVIAKNVEPEDISKVSGIPKGWNRSEYNTRKSANKAMSQLIKDGLEKSKYILLSYNDEGIVTKDDWNILFNGYTVEKKEIVYNTYKGSRNLKDRNNKVNEIMYLISK